MLNISVILIGRPKVLERLLRNILRNNSFGPKRTNFYDFFVLFYNYFLNIEFSKTQVLHKNPQKFGSAKNNKKYNLKKFTYLFCTPLYKEGTADISTKKERFLKFFLKFFCNFYKIF